MKILTENCGSHFDPEIMDAFKKIARPPYDRYVNRDDKRPKQDLQWIIENYFSGDFDGILFAGR